MSRWFGIVISHDGRELPFVLKALARLTRRPSELVVSSDGILDNVPDLLEKFSKESGIPAAYVRRPFKGAARRSQTRNNAVRALAAKVEPDDMLFFLDGDVLVRPGHIERLSRFPEADVVLSYVWRLDAARSDQLRDCMAGEQPLFPPNRSERSRLVRYAVKTWALTWLRRAQRKTGVSVGQPWWPTLASCNFAVRYRAFAAVNGFDEEFIDWGSEDVDLGMRLYAAGFRARTAILGAAGYHLWHPIATQGAQRRLLLKERQAILKSQKPVSARWGLTTPYDQRTEELLITEWGESKGLLVGS